MTKFEEAEAAYGAAKADADATVDEAIEAYNAAIKKAEAVYSAANAAIRKAIAVYSAAMKEAKAAFDAFAK
jgi:predicted NBD/HSP70 family sugar kinase